MSGFYQQILDVVLNLIVFRRMFKVFPLIVLRVFFSVGIITLLFNLLGEWHLNSIAKWYRAFCWDVYGATPVVLTVNNCRCRYNAVYLAAPRGSETSICYTYCLQFLFHGASIHPCVCVPLINSSHVFGEECHS